MPVCALLATVLALALLNLALPSSAKPQDRFLLSLLGESPVTGPNQLLGVIDWRFRKLQQQQQQNGPANHSGAGNGSQPHNGTFYARLVKILGVQISIKCTDIPGGRPMDEHCPCVHYIVKHVAMRIIFLTMGSLAAALGTCDLAFARKFADQRRTVLRQIPLSRRNTVMQGFDMLRNRNRTFERDFRGSGHAESNLQLFDVKDAGRREELLRQRDVDN